MSITGALPLIRLAAISILWTIGTMALYALVFVPLERMFASLPQRVWRRGSATDLFYWILQSPVSQLYTVALTATASAFSIGWLVPRNTSATLGHLPAWLQIVVFLFVSDLIQYWTHRLLHTAACWRVHVVHHSSTELDWMTTYRRHPLETWLSRFASLFGAWFVMSPPAMAGYIYVSSFINYLPHANLNWTYGPLRYVFVSPVFHRWHHTHTDEGGLRNFANVFSCIDLLFGTYYFPLNATPRNFGPTDEVVPENILVQLAYPIVRQNPTSEVPTGIVDSLQNI